LGGLPYLKRLGHTVAIAPSNAQAVDIFVADDRGRPISMRVKARTNANHWGLPPDAERMEDQRHFYCLDLWAKWKLAPKVGIRFHDTWHTFHVRTF
jgi:hypothetical protein